MSHGSWLLSFFLFFCINKLDESVCHPYNETYLLKKGKRFHSSLENLKPEESRAYDWELIKQLISIKKLRENFKKDVFYATRELAVKQRIDNARHAVQNLHWFSNPFEKAAAGVRSPRGKKSNFQPTENEYGVFKLPFLDYYVWTDNEAWFRKNFTNEQKPFRSTYIDKGNPLKGLTLDEVKQRLKSVSSDNDGSQELFDDPKLLDFLKGVYYNFLNRSLNSKPIKGSSPMNEYYSELSPGLHKVVGKNFNYFTKHKYRHLFIGFMERNPPLEEDNLFPHYVPIGLPEHLKDYYYKNIAVDYKQALKYFTQSYDPLKLDVLKGPRKSRITGSICYQIATYNKVKKKDKVINWNYKVNVLYNSSFKGNLYTMYGETAESGALYSFYRTVGCVPQISGMFVNPNAPYLGFSPDGLTYCHGETWLIEVKSPFLGTRMPCSSLFMNHTLPYLQVNVFTGQIELKERHKYYGQVQLGMALLKLNKCFFCIYCSFDNSSIIIKVPFSKTFFDDFLVELYSAYFSKILPRLEKGVFTIQ